MKCRECNGIIEARKFEFDTYVVYRTKCLRCGRTRRMRINKKGRKIKVEGDSQVIKIPVKQG